MGCSGTGITDVQPHVRTIKTKTGIGLKGGGVKSAEILLDFWKQGLVWIPTCTEIGSFNGKMVNQEYILKQSFQIFWHRKRDCEQSFCSYLRNNSVVQSYNLLTFGRTESAGCTFKQAICTCVLKWEHWHMPRNILLAATEPGKVSLHALLLVYHILLIQTLMLYGATVLTSQFQ